MYCGSSNLHDDANHVSLSTIDDLRPEEGNNSKHEGLRISENHSSTISDGPISKTCDGLATNPSEVNTDTIFEHAETQSIADKILLLRSTPPLMINPLTWKEMIDEFPLFLFLFYSQKANMKSELSLKDMGFRLPSSKVLKVRNPRIPIHLILLKHLELGIGTDVTVKIGGRKFACHLILLRIYSNFFCEIKKKEIELPRSKVSPKIFSLIYAWMRSLDEKCYKILNRKNILPLLKAVEFLGVTHLQAQCEDFLRCEKVFFGVQTYIMFLSARDMGNEPLSSLMLNKTKNFLPIVRTLHFLQSTTEEVCLLLGSDLIVMDCEQQVFMSGVHWLFYDWDIRRHHIAAVMSCVRFRHIPPCQIINIARNPANTEFIKLRAECPEVKRMMEEGLTQIILQGSSYCSQEDNDASSLERNYMNAGKKYFTYKEFLEELKLISPVVSVTQHDDRLQKRFRGDGDL